MKSVSIRVQKEAGTEDLPLPRYMTSGSSGMDLCAAVKEPVTLQPGETRLISTGLSLAIPEGFEVQVRPRSGLALKNQITLLNTPGTIDSDYRGLLSLIVTNFGKEPFVVTRGLRLAQMIVQEVIKAEFELVDELDATERHTGGFGHTGVHHA